MLQMPSFPMLCEARHTLHFGLLRTRVKRSPGWVLPRAAVDGGNIKNNQFIAQQVRCCVLHGNAPRKALMLPQFANEMLRFCMSLTCQIPMTIQGQCWSMSQDFCAPHLYPHGALKVQKEGSRRNTPVMVIYSRGRG